MGSGVKCCQEGFLEEGWGLDLAEFNEQGRGVSGSGHRGGKGTQPQDLRC